MTRSRTALQLYRLQVFVSSTFKDLVTERQAAVEAILEASHIPAGMELFTAGDESQWKIIQDWIRDSDVYMLIMGGRYGTVYPRSRKSYTEMEYNFARKLKKPLFALLASDVFINRQVASGQLDRRSADFLQAKQFRNRVSSNQIVNFFDNRDQLKLFTVRALDRIKGSRKLEGWIRTESTAMPGIVTRDFVFPSIWAVGHGYLPDIEEKHNYRAIARFVDDVPSAVLRIGSPQLLYWADPAGMSRLEWLLTHTSRAKLEVILFNSTNDKSKLYQNRRAIIAKKCATVAGRHRARLTFKESSLAVDLSYILYPLRQDKGKSARAIIGFQTDSYQDRPFLEFVYPSSNTPPIVKGIEEFHKKVIRGK